MISQERIRRLNNNSINDNPYVVYWMQSAQRCEYNHALEYAIEQANILKKHLIVYFGLTNNYPEANERHYYFMLEGLKEVKTELYIRNIQMIILNTSPELGALEISNLACLMVVDRGYLRIERQWRDYLARNAKCSVVQIETNVIVPIQSVSIKEEYSARTIRSKIYKVIDRFSIPFNEEQVLISSLDIKLPFIQINIDNIDTVIDQLQIDKSVKPVKGFIGGTSHAKILLEDFILNKLSLYRKMKNNPEEDYGSNLSPYLHFGQISPLYILIRMKDIDIEDKEEFLEQLIIRRELSFNFVYYNKKYDSYDSIPSWAQISLKNHIADEREYLYTLKELEEAKTHDKYWNAAQKEMVITGKMSGYMRMYWGKKIIEWSSTPQEAYIKAIYLNNKYSLDGKDPNAFTGVAWCFGKHDRPWTERKVFGYVRYMNAAGLIRKFDMEKYINKISNL